MSFWSSQLVPDPKSWLWSAERNDIPLLNSSFDGLPYGLEAGLNGPLLSSTFVYMLLESELIKKLDAPQVAVPTPGIIKGVLASWADVLESWWSIIGLRGWVRDVS